MASFSFSKSPLHQEKGVIKKTKGNVSRKKGKKRWAGEKAPLFSETMFKKFCRRKRNFPREIFFGKFPGRKGL